MMVKALSDKEEQIASKIVDSEAVYRVIDANLNRLREALRVVEEYYRFIQSDEVIAGELKLLRHSLEELDEGFDRGSLLESRDTGTDPFAYNNREEELSRAGVGGILTANFKRSQEAARVLEEYVKVSKKPGLSEKAKHIRFALYSLEKSVMEKQSNG